MEFFGCFKYGHQFKKLGVFYKQQGENDYLVESLEVNEFGIEHSGLTVSLPIVVLVKDERVKVTSKTIMKPIYVVDFSAFELGYLYFRAGNVVYIFLPFFAVA
jgi:hypothetical protein